MKDKYEKILYNEVPKSRKHPPMPLKDRAAQFAPFAALVGYDEEIKDGSKYREEKRLLSSEQIEELDYKLKEIILKKVTTIMITYFKQDGLNKGNYLTKKIKIKEIDLLCQRIISEDEIIPFRDIYDLEFLE